LISDKKNPGKKPPDYDKLARTKLNGITLFLVSDPLCLSSALALHFFQLFFWVHHLVNWDDRHVLAHAMASDFSVARQCLSK
jgi:hypothetical protein